MSNDDHNGNDTPQEYSAARLKRSAKVKILERFLSRQLTLSQHAVLSFIFDRTERFNKKWEIISINQIRNGIEANDGAVIHSGLGLSRTTISKSLNYLVEAQILRLRKVKRLGTTWYSYSINWDYLHEVSWLLDVDPYNDVGEYAYT